MSYLSQNSSQIIFLDSIKKDLSVCTHLGIGAHQDDLEVMAGHGILACQNHESNHFVGVTSTSGGGSARSGEFKNLSDDEMKEVRRKEQIDSAKLGKFHSIIQLGFESSQIKKNINKDFIKDLKDIILKTKPQIIYTHNLADKHQTHVAVSAHVIEALRQIDYKPMQFLGCEVWRGLDWLSDDEKIPLEISNPQMIIKLIECHKSQTAGGKRYDLATMGRMKANATFFDSHQIDQSENLWFAMNLMPFLENKKMKTKDFINSHLEKLKNEIMLNLDHF